jgi:hypothetical protein
LLLRGVKLLTPIDISVSASRCLPVDEPHRCPVPAVGLRQYPSVPVLAILFSATQCHSDKGVNFCHIYFCENSTKAFQKACFFSLVMNFLEIALPWNSG